LQHYLAHYGEALSRVVQAESSFSLGLGHHVLVGKIDLLRRTDDGYELVDFKTGKSAPAALEQVDQQLDLYALGVESNLKRPLVRQSAHFLEDAKLYTRSWSAERAALVQQRLSSLLAEIDRHAFEPRRAYCSRCIEFRTLCPYAEEE
jgi:RecB family exonuclease